VPAHEHSDLIDAIEAHDEAKAAACMLQHLQHIEATLNFDEVKNASLDIEAIFS
jgi:DNA-binding GntR family transcriptional regulator